MVSDKQIKQQFKVKASKQPDKYYATNILKKQGFARKKCPKCGTYFWNTTNSNLCGDPACTGGFRFFDKTPAKKKLDYIETWQLFAKLFKKWGYEPIKRYPVTARWRDDTDFVQASIYDFQPYVVSGEVAPPANPLVVPQFCLRFNDIDNVGITGAHYTGFVMIGQHAFNTKQEWNQDKYFTDIHNWLVKGLGLKNEEITYHEDAWAGGGNFGPCMEYFSRGLELGNQVYMLYEKTPDGYKELNLKVLDMGMGHERNTWFTNATSTSYDCVMPTVMKKLYSTTNIEIDNKLIKKFLPYSSYLNVDEVENIDKVWQFVSKKINVEVKELKQKISQLAALYSIAEHSRALLVALTDGALPSNVGGGYNLRIILRRALSFINEYKWDINLAELCKLHASYLKPLFPELSKNLDEVKKIIEVEKNKFKATKQKSKQIIINLVKTEIDDKKLLQLYDSQGIAPEIIREEALKLGRQIAIPENFYARVAELHEQKEQLHATEKTTKLNLRNIPETQALYFDDYLKLENKAKVLKIIENNVILNKTVAYPTSGGQLHDIGFINNQKIIDVFKQGSVIIHVLENKPKLKQSGTVLIKIDKNRRLQLAQHHTATHIINAAARNILGKHIYQAGAKKTIEKAHLDVTHFENISDKELKEIEKQANKIVKSNVKVNKFFLPRSDAEKKYGMSIYQGGAVPGKKIRIVDIANTDIEACGGTHLNSTREVGEIKILKSTKIQDGVVRITFTAGKAKAGEEEKERSILEEISKLLNVKQDQIPARAQELFDKWKKARKSLKKGKKIAIHELELVSKEIHKGDVLAKTSEILRTQPYFVSNTIKRFMKELEELKRKLK